eukprot:5482039-Amphidinium_carterae.1
MARRPTLQTRGKRNQKSGRITTTQNNGTKPRSKGNSPGCIRKCGGFTALGVWLSNEVTPAMLHLRSDPPVRLPEQLPN